MNLGQLPQALQHHIANLLLRWSTLSSREQVAISGATVVLTATLIYSAVVEPMYAAHSKAQSTLETAQAAFVSMQSKAQTISEAKLSINLDKGKSLLYTAEKSAIKQNLRSSIKSMSVKGEVLHVDLTKTDYSKVIKWLIKLEEQGINVNKLNVQLEDNEINAQLSLKLL